MSAFGAVVRPVIILLILLGMIWAFPNTKDRQIGTMTFEELGLAIALICFGIMLVRALFKPNRETYRAWGITGGADPVGNRWFRRVRVRR